jgi:signal transduction histidine kinase
LLQTKDKLFSIVSHDLRSPFAGLLTLVNIMVETYDSYEKEELRESLMLIRDTSDQLHSLIQNMLNWARLQNRVLEYRPSKLHLLTQIRKSVEVLAMNSSKKDITLKCEVDNNFQVTADPDMLRIILHNLLGNAIKFSNTGSSVFIESESQNNRIITRIIDTGVGMPSDRVEEFFSTGKSVSTAGTANEAGSGLGLMLCKEMVEKMGGLLGVESKPGEGSTFWFALNTA